MPVLFNDALLVVSDTMLCAVHGSANAPRSAFRSASGALRDVLAERVIEHTFLRLYLVLTWSVALPPSSLPTARAHAAGEISLLPSTAPSLPSVLAQSDMPVITSPVWLLRA